MWKNKALISALLLVAATGTAAAQSSTNSPYTRYGLGELSDMGFTNNAAMGGIGYGLRNGENINMMNPASYTSVEHLSFKFDLGMSLKNSKFKENGIKNSAKNSSFDYIAMQFRLHPRLGMTVGFTPFSNVGYNFKKSRPVAGDESVTETSFFYGDGGLQRISVGLGFKILENLSIGANAGFMYGNIEYQNSIGFNVPGEQTIQYNHINAKGYVADFGIQYTLPFNKNNKVTLGTVYSIGHDLNTTETSGIQLTGSESDEHVIQDSYSIPHTFGVGAAYQYKDNLTAGIDYTFQNWESAKNGNPECKYKNRSKLAVGAEYLPNVLSRNYLKRIRYRIGAYYNGAYFDTPKYEGPTECGISAGFGFPLQMFQRNSLLNITGQYTRVKPSVGNMLSENRFVIKIGLTFNERWFMKWKVN